MFKKNVFPLFILFIILVNTGCSKGAGKDGQEIIKNGSFTLDSNESNGVSGVKGTAFWVFGTNSGGNARCYNEDGIIKVADYVSGGDQVYAVQFMQENINIEQGSLYRVTFQAKSTEPRSISVKVGGLADRGWSDYSQGTNHGVEFNLTTQLSDYEIEFLMEDPTDPAARLEFQLGIGKADVWITNVSLKKLTSSSAAYEKGAIKNGTFDTDYMFWKEWAVAEEWAGNGEMILGVEKGELVVDVKSPGSVEFNPQIKQMGLLFEEGKTYKVTFYARSSKSRKIQVNVGLELTEDPWFIPYVDTQVIQLAAAMQPYTFTFLMSEATTEGSNGKIVFEFGTIKGESIPAKIYIDSVSVEDLNKPAVFLTPLSENELVVNGNFDRDRENWSTNGDISLEHTNAGLFVKINEGQDSSPEDTLSQEGISLEKKGKYLVSFVASSDVHCNTGVAIVNKEGTKTYLKKSDAVFSLTDRKHYYHYFFQMNEKSDKESTLVFSFNSSSACRVNLDRISIRKADDYLDAGLPVGRRVENLLSKMSIDEKLGQMVQSERVAVKKGDIKRHYIGSILSGGGSVPFPNSPEGWIKMYNGFQEEALATALGIPILYGIDAVHGNTNVAGATVFPHNIGLGATKNPALIEEIAGVTAKEIAVTGVDWNFAPCVAVTRDERWGRSYESYGESPELQELYAAAYTRGLQGSPGSADFMKNHHVVGSAKHFIGDGGAEWNTGEGNYTVDRGDITTLNLSELKKIHGKGYEEAIKMDVGTVMASFNTYKGRHMHAYKELLTDYLKAPRSSGGLGFEGFVVGDWDGMSLLTEIKGTYDDKILAAFNAGLDMSMEQANWLTVIKALQKGLKEGKISRARIDDAVRRILTVKFKAGIFENPYALANDLDSFGSKAHRDVAARAVKESLVLLKNKNDILPLDGSKKIFVTGPAADNVGYQCGGWTIAWQGGSDSQAERFVPGTSILDGIKEQVKKGGGQIVTDSKQAGDADYAVVIVGEEPYAEGVGDIQKGGTLALSDGYAGKIISGSYNTIREVSGMGIPVIVILISGRPLIVTDEIEGWDALVAAWLPGSEGGAIGDVLFGEENFKGKLPVTWPRSIEQLPINVGDPGYGQGDKKPLFEYGYGLTMNL